MYGGEMLIRYSLGDRHGENILFEEGNGGTMHVDFNCLFDKVGLLLTHFNVTDIDNWQGLTFEKPEMVPFRLTHNMVDAFGVYGFEGLFDQPLCLPATLIGPLRSLPQIMRAHATGPAPARGYPSHHSGDVCLRSYDRLHRKKGNDATIAPVTTVAANSLIEEESGQRARDAAGRPGFCPR